MHFSHKSSKSDEHTVHTVVSGKYSKNSLKCQSSQSVALWQTKNPYRYNFGDIMKLLFQVYSYEAKHKLLAWYFTPL